jgi:hypothetical protein
MLPLAMLEAFRSLPKKSLNPPKKFLILQKKPSKNW